MSLDLRLLIYKMRVITAILEEYCEDKIRESLDVPGVSPHTEQCSMKGS